MRRWCGHHCAFRPALAKRKPHGQAARPSAVSPMRVLCPTVALPVRRRDPGMQIRVSVGERAQPTLAGWFRPTSRAGNASSSPPKTALSPPIVTCDWGRCWARHPQGQARPRGLPVSARVRAWRSLTYPSGSAASGSREKFRRWTRPSSTRCSTRRRPAAGTRTSYDNSLGCGPKPAARRRKCPTTTERSCWRGAATMAAPRRTPLREH